MGEPRQFNMAMSTDPNTILITSRYKINSVTNVFSFEKYTQALFELLNHNNTEDRKGHEMLLKLFIGFFDLKWYLLSRLKKLEITHPNKPRNLVELMENLCTESLQAGLITPIVTKARLEHVSIDEAIKRLNAYSMFQMTPQYMDTVESETLYPAVMGSPSDMLDLRDYLMNPILTKSEGTCLDSLARFQRIIFNIFELADRNKLRGLETSLLVVATLPQLRKWYVENLISIDNLLEGKVTQFLETKDLNWVRTNVFAHAPVYLSNLEYTQRCSTLSQKLRRLSKH